MTNIQDLTLKDRLHLVSFRFIALYLMFYIWPFPIYFIPGSDFVLSPIDSAATKIIDIIGSTILGKLYNPIHVITGSGDTSFQYVQVFFFLVLALVSSIIWSIFDWRRSSHKNLSIALNILVQFYLASILLGYGFQKIFPLQFPTPTASRLTQTYGESSPMGLLWTFMGSSRLYSVFTGISEILAGIGLLFRRTKLLAAILASFIFMHILVLNLSYDVPVKLFSFQLLLMAIFLIKPHVKKIIDAITVDKVTNFAIWPGKNAEKYQWLILGLKSVLICCVFLPPLLSALKRNGELNQPPEDSSKNEIFGTYTVLSIKGNDQRQATQRPVPEWKEIKLNANLLEVIYADGFSIQWYSIVLSQSKVLRFASKDLSSFGQLEFNKQNSDLWLTGKLNQDSIRVHARQTSSYNSPLLNREFHWISEEPFYR